MQGLGNRTVGSKKNLAMQQLALSHIARSIDDSELRSQVTPNYPFGCKRLIRDSNFLATLNDPNVSLVPREVTAVRPQGVVDDSGEETAVDVIVAAIGFRPTEYLVSLPIVGPNGVTLQEHWAEEPTAYLGVTVPGFPNLFLLYGPNTNGGASIIAQDERAAEVMVRVARRMVRNNFSVVDTRNSAEREFTDWVDKRNRINWGATFAGCHNYYMSPSGRNVTQYPEGQIHYWWRTRWMDRVGLRLEKRNNRRDGSEVNLVS
jgi:cation diffusion facilitator CzcD-associated flavoprotein CzcO